MSRKHNCLGELYILHRLQFFRKKNVKARRGKKGEASSRGEERKGEECITILLSYLQRAFPPEGRDSGHSPKKSSLAVKRVIDKWPAAVTAFIPE